MNKEHCNTIIIDDKVDDSLGEKLIKKSYYRLTKNVSYITKKQKSKKIINRK